MCIRANASQLILLLGDIIHLLRGMTGAETRAMVGPLHQPCRRQRSQAQYLLSVHEDVIRIIGAHHSKRDDDGVRLGCKHGQIIRAIPSFFV